MNGEVNGTMEEPMQGTENIQVKVTGSTFQHEERDESDHCSSSNHITELKGSQLKNSGDEESKVENSENNSDENSDAVTLSCNNDDHDDVCTNNKVANQEETFTLDEGITELDNNTDVISEQVCKNKAANIDQNCGDMKSKDMPSDDKTSIISAEEIEADNVIVNSDSSKEKSSDDKSSIISAEEKGADTVIVNSDTSKDKSSDDESSTQSEKEEVPDNVIINSDTDNPGDVTPQQNNKQNNSGLQPQGKKWLKNSSDSPDVQEIPNDDDCVVTDERGNGLNKKQLRRSARAIARKKYDVEESDDEESEPIVVDSTKTLVEMTAKNMISGQANAKNQTTVVIIDTNSKVSPTQNKGKPSKSNVSTQSLYQSIVSRGTTVTPIKGNTNNSSTMTVTPNRAIIPSLTDDMFVVEAPSFIVPYVYEKPPIKPFREFVDSLGKELKEKQSDIKEELEKGKKNKKKRKHKTELTGLDGLAAIMEAERDSDDSSWADDASTTSSDEAEVLPSEEEAASPPKKKSTKQDTYFNGTLGKFFTNLGLSLVTEYVQNDLLQQQKHKLSKVKKSGHSTKGIESSISALKRNLDFSKENNAPYRFPQKKCEFCSFRTESAIVLSHHKETPHMKNSMYKCNFCTYTTKLPQDILYHLECQHKVRGRLERASAYHQCPTCPFEDNGKVKFTRHQVACAKRFKPEFNLTPPIDWEPPAKIPKVSQPRNVGNSNTYPLFNRQMASSSTRPIPITNLMSVGGFRPRGRTPVGAPSRAAAPMLGVGASTATAVVRGGLTIRHGSLSPAVAPSHTITSNGKKPQPSISITPLPRQAQPAATPAQPQKSNTFVICEICDGYIKDLEQLRNHMQWIHKVKIHPKMIYNRPPLNCQKCQFRFFTDQGLERHLLGSHGLVTTSMQDSANKGKDAGRCPVCGRVFQWRLLNHVSRDHNVVLKPAHLSYKCTVCTATFSMYKLFESHVYSAHSMVAKRVTDKSPPKSKPTSTVVKPTAPSKPLTINDDVTITPQSAKPATTTRS